MGFKPRASGFAALGRFEPVAYSAAAGRFQLAAPELHLELDDVLGRTPETVHVAGKTSIDGDVAVRLIGGVAGVYVIDGDLSVGGIFEYDHTDGSSVLIVTGTLKAKSLALGSESNLWVGGDLRLNDHLIAGSGDAGSLRVGGKTSARVAIACSVGESHHLGDNATTLLRGEAFQEAVAPTLGFDFEDLADALRKGRPILASEVRAPAPVIKGGKALKKLRGFSPMSPAKARKTYGLDAVYTGAYPMGKRPSTIHVRPGSAHIKGDLLLRRVAGKKREELFVVDGDLIVDGVMDVTSQYMMPWGCLHVTGDVRARSLCVRDHGALSIGGNLIVEDYIVTGGHRCSVGGKTTATAIIADFLFPYYASKPEARIVVRDRERFETHQQPSSLYRLPAWCAGVTPELSARALKPEYAGLGSIRTKECPGISLIVVADAVVAGESLLRD